MDSGISAGKLSRFGLEHQPIGSLLAAEIET